MPKLFRILLFCITSLTTSKAQDRPNIVFIFADDWGWGDLSCHDHPFIKTPHIDRLAKEGADFQRFTVASGVCSPSRAAVMTGHFPAKHNITGHFATVNSNQKRNMPDWLQLDAPYLARMLQQAGYRTAHYGKWHLSNNMIHDSPTPDKYGYDDYGTFNCSGPQMPWFEDAKRTSAFIEESVASKKPFFVNVWMHEPHTPFHTIPKYEARFSHLTNRSQQIYASVLSHADDRVGEILDTLDRLKIKDNTLVIFSSDNGPAGNGIGFEPKLKYDTATGAGWDTGASVGSTAGRRGRKASLFEGGIGVPFLVRWPAKITPNTIDNDSVISAVDLLPTFCAIANAPFPNGYQPDGMDITPVLLGKKLQQRPKNLFWKMPAVTDPKSTKNSKWAAWAILQDPWKLVTSENFELFELYHLKEDYKESINYAEQQPELTERLLQKLKAWKATLPEKPEGAVFSSARQ